MFISLLDLPEKEIISGFFGKFHHTENLSIGYFNIDAGSELPTHQHIHTQITHVLSGELEFNLNGEIQILSTGKIVSIPPNVPHSAKALTDCVVLDVFNPAREDYKF